MSADRAQGLGEIFNARKREKKTATTPAVDPMPQPAPGSVPQTVPHDDPSDMPSSAVEQTRESVPHPMPARESEARQHGDGGEALVVSNTAVYMPVSVRERLRAAQAERGLTYTDLLIDAFDELTHEQLLEACGCRPQSGGGMPRRRRGAARGQGGVQVQLRLDQEQRAWLDEQVALLGAPSRSALVASVLNAWLPQK